MPALVAQLDAPSDWRPGGRGFNPRRGRQHSFVEIDHEIFSAVILSLPLIQEGQLSVSPFRWFKKGSCQFLSNYCSYSQWYLVHAYILAWPLECSHPFLTLAGLGGSVWCAVRLETRRSRVQPPPRSATFFRGDWSWNIFCGHSLPSADSRRAVVSFWRKNVHSTG